VPLTPFVRCQLTRPNGTMSLPKPVSQRLNLDHLGFDVLNLVNLRLGNAQGPQPGSLAEPFETLVRLQQQGLIRHLRTDLQKCAAIYATLSIGVDQLSGPRQRGPQHPTLREGPGPCLAVSEGDSALLSRSCQNGGRVVPGRGAQFYGVNMG
jgi:hypothetical protein